MDRLYRMRALGTSSSPQCSPRRQFFPTFPPNFPHAHVRGASVVAAAGGKSAVGSYECSECGAKFSQSAGRCNVCKSFGTVEKIAAPQFVEPPAGAKGASRAVLTQLMATRTASTRKAKSEGSAAEAEGRAPRVRVASSDLEDDDDLDGTPFSRASSQWFTGRDDDVPESLASIGTSYAGRRERLLMRGELGTELNRILGGGLHPQSCALIAGEPGVGKSTLLLQLAAELATLPDAEVREVLQAEGVGPVLYVSGEESKHQVYERAKRMGLGKLEGVYLWNSTDVVSIAEVISKIHARAVIVDSIQRMVLPDCPGAAGSVTQVKECATVLNQVSKMFRSPLFLVGHVTKDNSIAGPRQLEHLVDATLYLDGDRSDLRILRSLKNRFGATDEVVVLDMQPQGLVVVSDPGQVMMQDRLDANREGGATVVGLGKYGRSTAAVEIEALSSMSRGASKNGGYDVPVRVYQNVNRIRVQILLNVLSRYAGIYTSGRDVFVSTVGGLKAETTDFDLPIALALAASVKNIPLPLTMAAVGEVALTGDVRSVSDLDGKIKEAARLGFKSIIVPRSVKGGPKLPKDVVDRIEVIPVRSVKEAIRKALDLQEGPEAVEDEAAKASRKRSYKRETMMAAKDDDFMRRLKEEIEPEPEEFEGEDPTFFSLEQDQLNGDDIPPP